MGNSIELRHEILGAKIGAIGANLGANVYQSIGGHWRRLAPSGAIGAKIGAWIGANGANLGANGAKV